MKNNELVAVVGIARVMMRAIMYATCALILFGWVCLIHVNHTVSFGISIVPMVAVFLGLSFLETEFSKIRSKLS